MSQMKLYEGCTLITSGTRQKTNIEASLVAVWPIANPSFHCPIQMLPDKVRHLSLHRSVASLLRRLCRTVWLHSGPPSNFSEQIFSPLRQEIFILDSPQICHSLIFLDAQKVANFFCSKFHDIVVGSATSIVPHFIKGLVPTVVQLFVGRSRKRFRFAGDNILVFKVFLASSGIVYPVRPYPFHGPWGSQEFHPSIVSDILKMLRGMVRDVLHGLEPVVGVPKLCNHEGFVRVSIRCWILKPVFVPGQLCSHLPTREAKTKRQQTWSVLMENQRPPHKNDNLRITYLNCMVETFCQMAANGRHTTK
jgi:hypothetical protein